MNKLGCLKLKSQTGPVVFNNQRKFQLNPSLTMNTYGDWEGKIDRVSGQSGYWNEKQKVIYFPCEGDGKVFTEEGILVEDPTEFCKISTPSQMLNWVPNIPVLMRGRIWSKNQIQALIRSSIESIHPLTSKL